MIYNLYMMCIILYWGVVFLGCHFRCCILFGGSNTSSSKLGDSDTVREIITLETSLRTTYIPPNDSESGTRIRSSDLESK